MTKSIDEMTLEELRDALRWERDDKQRVIDHLTAYRSAVTAQFENIEAAVNRIWRAS